MPVLCTQKARVGLKLAIFGLCIPVVCLFLLEGTLRAINYGWPTHFFEKQQINGQECYVTNHKFSWRFFPQRMARASTPLVVPLHKTPGAIRIFVLGSSAAMGDPEPAFSFSRHLEVMLKQRYPGKKFEVYNTAATAINSNVVLPTARDCLDLEPDLFVIYTGNNEVLGPYGPSAVLAPFLSSRFLIKTQVAIGQTKTGQLLKTLFNKHGNSTPHDWGGLALFMEHRVPYDSPELKPVYSHYHDNLAEICQRARSKGVKVVLSTLIVNDLDCAPFASLHKPDLDSAGLQKFDTLYQSGQKFESSQQWQQALQAYVQAAEVDPAYAELQFRLGRCYLQLNQTNLAAQCLAKARDLDALRFRADTRLTETVHQVAQQNPSVFLADAQAAAQKNSPNGIPGANLLYEHVHLNFEGNYLLASCVLDQVEKALGLNTSIAKPSLLDCKKRLAFTLFDEKRICDLSLERIKAPPFTTQLHNESDVKNLTNRIADLQARLKDSGSISSDELYRSAIALNPNDWWLHHDYMGFLFDNHRYSEALEQAEAVFKQIPFAYMSLLNMGVMLHSVQKYDQAESFFNRAIATNPYARKAHDWRATLYEDEKRFEAAEACYKTNNPAELPGFYNRTGLEFAKQRQYDTALAYFNRALSIQPDFADAKANVERCLQQKQNVAASSDPEAMAFYTEGNRFLRDLDFPKAIELYKQAVAKDPDFAKAHNNLGIALYQNKDYDEAAHHFSEAIRLNMPDAVPNYANMLSVLGKHEEAITLLQKAAAEKASRRLYVMLAQEFQKTGKTNEALDYMAKTKDPALP